jgi:hypothetical protein
MKVLILEARILPPWLRLDPNIVPGHELKLYRGAHVNKSGELIGISARHAAQVERIELTGYSLAVVAGRLETLGTLGTEYGWKIVLYLEKLMPCIGISTDTEDMLALLSAGAQLCFPTQDLVTRLPLILQGVERQLADGVPLAKVDLLKD